MELIDTHAHLDEEAFEGDRRDTIERAVQSGVVATVTIGTTASSSRAAVEIAREFPSIYAAIGIQPNYVAEAAQEDWTTIETLAGDPRVVAIGETGLDRYWDYAPIEQQVDYFSRHIELAKQRDLPFVVHCRDAEADVVAQLRDAAGSGLLRGVMHSFSGDLATADVCLELGLYLSFAGMVTYKKNKDLRRVAAAVPPERLLVETDSPYLSPTPKRGKRNEPANVRHTLECLAEVRGVPADQLAEQTTRNARELFRI